MEITGGEATIHPQITEIIEFACSLNFVQISLLSNGLNLNDRLLNTIVKNKDKIFVQIDMHSFDKEYLLWFTKVHSVLENARKNIEFLAQQKVKMRVATIITPKNLDEFEPIANWVHSLGIAHYGVSLVIPIGRAVDHSELLLNQEELVRFDESLVRINNTYKNFLNLIDVPIAQHGNNCGALTSHCIITAKGDIKLCNMDNLKYFNSNFGNVFEKNIKDLYNDNFEFINSFINLPTVKETSEECKKCENYNFCYQCILRSLIKANELKEKCNWYNEVVPNDIKKRLFA
ncbi:radical SAM protein [Paenibacillus sp. YN15]|uniref:radical SAM protein n=1 Tax=Paenibacillus sp. YN15 TaxID=1742774 RepID=UPI0037C7F6B4